MRLGLLACWLGLAAPLAADLSPTAQTVAELDLARYAGAWHEIAAFPMRFQRGCTGTIATYTLQPDGTVKVHNQCRRDRLEGKLSEIKGKAWRPDPAHPGRLKVQFFWPLSADYWVLELGKDYEYAVVGHPRKSSCWILARKTRMDPALYDGIVERLKQRGYDVGRLQRTLQPG